VAQGETELVGRAKRRLTWTIALLWGLVASPSAAAAEPAEAKAGAVPESGDESGDEPLPWTWRRHHPIDYGATAVFTGAALLTELLPHDGAASWVGGELFDSEVRDRLMLGGFGNRRVVARISDGMLAALVAYPVVVDGLLVTWAGWGAGDTAWQLIAMDVQMFAFNAALTGLVKRVADRERPSGTACRSDPRYDRRCEDQSTRGSFFSGHTSFAFTAASLACTHHAQLGLFGPVGDALACLGTTVGATMVGFERIAADRHYATDVIVGAAAGVTSGALLPWALFFAHPADEDPSVAWRAVPVPQPGGAGLALTGVW
jgi:membrane-associated phospholipid phosphatase